MRGFFSLVLASMLITLPLFAEEKTNAKDEHLSIANVYEHETIAGFEANPAVPLIEIRFEENLISSGAGIIVSDYAAPQGYTVSPLRRGSIMFAISFPFAYVYSVLALAAIDTTGSSIFNITHPYAYNYSGLQRTSILFSFVSAFLWASVITYDDSVRVYGAKAGVAPTAFAPLPQHLASALPPLRDEDAGLYLSLRYDLP